MIVIHIIYVLVKAPPRVCMKNTARRGCVERQIQHEAKPSAVVDADNHVVLNIRTSLV